MYVPMVVIRNDEDVTSAYTFLLLLFFIFRGRACFTSEHTEVQWHTRVRECSSARARVCKKLLLTIAGIL